VHRYVLGLYFVFVEKKKVVAFIQPSPFRRLQWTDPTGPGYTYAGLSDDESLKMALWRPLFEGLAEGIRSTAKTSRSGVGCLVQRGSILALRAILLRHGHLFSTPELTAVLSETILPAIQAAAESDQSPVVDITSETPAVSNIDFLVDPLPLPPDNDDPALQQFRELSAATTKRPTGPAELMLEASFTDVGIVNREIFGVDFYSDPTDIYDLLFNSVAPRW